MTLPDTLAPALADALADKGFSALTEVQAAVLEPQAAGADLLVSAQTGSGKTVAFGLTMAADLLAGSERLGQADAPLALVIAPTRELALQVERELAWLYAPADGRLATCVGGMDPKAERRALARGAHIVVGTPGRLRDHIERGALDLSAVRVAVLDEADEMLDFGFREDLEFILDAAPTERRTLLFSATVSKPIADLARRYQRDAERISTIADQGQHADIAYLVHAVAPSDRETAIVNVLRFHEAPRALVFCATREAVNRLTSRFGNRGFKAVALSGELTQAERTKALQALRDGRATVCIATDVAARGIDLPGLDLVIHADLPTNAETLLHRSGRTGRAGQKGVSVLIAPFPRQGRAKRLLRDARISADWTPAPDAEAVRARDRERLADHPALSAEPDEARRAEARDLVERFGAEQIAAAFLAQLEAGRPAPEELLNPDRGEARSGADPDGRSTREPKRARTAFAPGEWFEINVGRKQRAEPRWVLPMICRIGHVTRHEIGAIDIGERTTRFEITQDAVDRFEQAAAAPRERDEAVKAIRLGTDPAPRAERPDAKPAARAKPKPKPKRDANDRRRTKPGGEKRSQSTSGDKAWPPKGADKPHRSSAGSDPKLKRIKRRKPPASR